MTTGTTASGTYYLFNKKDQDVPIVFVHGVGLTHEIWQPQLEFFNYHSTLAYDILGHGKSSLENNLTQAKDRYTFDIALNNVKIKYRGNKIKIIGSFKLEINFL